MNNYIVITYDRKDEHYENPTIIERLHYSAKEDVKEYVLTLRHQANIKYEIYKELYSNIEEEMA